MKEKKRGTEYVCVLLISNIVVLFAFKHYLYVYLALVHFIAPLNQQVKRIFLQAI